MNKSLPTILVVDDEPSITEFVAYNLRKEGFEVEVANDGESGLQLSTTKPFNLIILDIMLPGIDGYEICRRIRSQSDVPVLFLSARDTELDKVVGLELGADDYLAKPFGVRELIARVKALLRRTLPSESSMGEEQTISASGVTLDEARHVATSKKGPIDLTPREFELLACLMKQAGKVLSREQLLHEAWDWEFIVETKTVDTHIKRLRDKLDASDVDSSLVETVRGYGYRFKVEE